MSDFRFNPLLSRRRTMKLLAAAGATATLGCTDDEKRDGPKDRPARGRDAVAAVEPLATPWQTVDPFLFCMHHLDQYPPGNAQLGPAASLAGHRIGQDFAGVDGWRMYHGETVPGFPRHPHRGFETVTVVRTGLLDHSDSMGATARYGQGDVQWLTAGGGIQHAEMFPLLRPNQENPVELFQLWLNLPSTHKMVAPHFAMLWQPSIPAREVRDEAGKRTRVTVIAGRYGDATAPAPPPRSWASEAEHHVAIWTIKMEPGATFDLPAAPDGVSRGLYFFLGSGLRVGGRRIPDYHLVRLRSGQDVTLQAGPTEVELLMLQGKPIGEPVARRGPIVMNSEAELRQAFRDYRRTGFGGWPWQGPEPVHERIQGRFALRPDGEIETPG